MERSVDVPREWPPNEARDARYEPRPNRGRKRDQKDIALGAERGGIEPTTPETRARAEAERERETRVRAILNAWGNGGPGQRGTQDWAFSYKKKGRFTADSRTVSAKKSVERERAFIER